jgi:hypothetical protein
MNYIQSQIAILTKNNIVQSIDGSWHLLENIITYEMNKPILTSKQRYLRALYLNRAFFSHDFIHWYSSASGLMNSLKRKSK